MKSKLPIESQRFKRIRQDLGHTQSEFAEFLNIGNTTADIERGKTRITGEAVAMLLDLYKIKSVVALWQKRK